MACDETPGDGLPFPALPWQSVAAVLIIYFQLTDFEWSVEASWRVVTVTNVQCLLGTSNGSSLCHLGYAVCGISLAAALAMAAVLVRKKGRSLPLANL